MIKRFEDFVNEMHGLLSDDNNSVEKYGNEIFSYLLNKFDDGEFEDGEYFEYDINTKINYVPDWAKGKVLIVGADKDLNKNAGAAMSYIMDGDLYMLKVRPIYDRESLMDISHTLMHELMHMYDMINDDSINKLDKILAGTNYIELLGESQYSPLGFYAQCLYRSFNTEMNAWLYSTKKQALEDRVNNRLSKDLAFHGDVEFYKAYIDVLKKINNKEIPESFEREGVSTYEDLEQLIFTEMKAQLDALYPGVNTLHKLNSIIIKKFTKQVKRCGKVYYDEYSKVNEDYFSKLASRKDNKDVRKGDEITEDYVRSFIFDGYEENYIKSITIRKENGKTVVDVVGSFFIDDVEEIPFQFGTVTGEFNCFGCKKLKSLKGCPTKAYCFNCEECTSLKSLDGSPTKVTTDFLCTGCTSLLSLEGCPKEVGGRFICKKCGRKFTEDEVKSLCNVKRIFV